MARQWTTQLFRSQVRPNSDVLIFLACSNAYCFPFQLAWSWCTSAALSISFGTISRDRTRFTQNWHQRQCSLPLLCAPWPICEYDKPALSFPQLSQVVNQRLGGLLIEAFSFSSAVWKESGVLCWIQTFLEAALPILIFCSSIFPVLEWLWWTFLSLR